MATLEVFNGNDQGYNAIAKIDRNTIAINQELGSALPKTDIINNLISTDTTKALAAPQGKILDDKISILSDDVTTQLAQTAQNVASNNTAILAIDRGIGGTKADLSTIQALPPDNSRYVNGATGLWYYHNGTAWVSGGTFQGTGIVDHSIIPRKTSFINLWNIFDDIIPLERWYVDASTGVGRILNDFFSYVSIIANESTTYYIFSPNGAVNKARSINYYDSTGTWISGDSYPNLEIETPVSCAFVSLTFNYLDSDTKEKADNYFTIYDNDLRNDKLNISVPFENVIGLNDKVTLIENNVEAISIAQSMRPIQLIRKPTFTFTFDDGTDGDVNIHELFNSYGFKCGFALVTNIHNDTAKVDRYLNYQLEGFEILSHSTDSVTMKDGILSVDVVEAKMKDSYTIHSNAGFNIKGWVTPLTWLNSIYFNSLKKYYEYGFGHLDTNSINHTHTFFGNDVRQLERWSLQSNAIADTLAKIDECIANNKYMCFYAHSYPQTIDNFTEANMNTILTYLKTKTDIEEIKVTTPNKAINSYYAVRHSDLLELFNT